MLDREAAHPETLNNIQETDECSVCFKLLGSNADCPKCMKGKSPDYISALKKETEQRDRATRRRLRK